MSRHTQSNKFNRGIGFDLDPGNLSTQMYHAAVNMEWTEENGFASLSSMRDDVVIAGSYVQSGHEIIDAWACKATFGTGALVRDSIFYMSKNAITGESALYILDTTTNKSHMIYNDAASPARARSYDLDIGFEVDCAMVSIGDRFYAYWIDCQNNIRSIKLHVEDPTVYDNSTGGNSVLYIPNEPDLLYVRRLFPVDYIYVTDVNQSGGVLRAGSYQFAYRYYNTETGSYSTFSLLTLPVPIIQDDLTAVTTNEITGLNPGAQTSKSIEITIPKSHFHHKYYNAIQLAVIRNMGINGVEPDAFLLRPNTDWYGTVGLNSIFEYIGNEDDEVVSTIEIVTDDSPIESAKTIQFMEGRLFIGDIKYLDLDIQQPSALAAETVVLPLNVGEIDPMEAVTAIDMGYYSELICGSYKGYWREEVYRFGRTYVGKFGDWARPLALDFSDPSLAYDPLNHATTWQLNWSASGTDWKFLDRQSKEGCIFNDSIEGINILGLNISGLDNHPDWAYGMAIVRLPRKKNILGQTPVINGVAYQGMAFMDRYKPDAIVPGDLKSKKFYIDSYAWDYDGKLDFIGPKTMAYGHSKHLTYAFYPALVTDPPGYPFHVWERAGTKFNSTVYDDNIYSGLSYDKAHVGIYFLYPLEYMANSASGPYSNEIRLDSTEYLHIVDCYMLKSFNAFRDSSLMVGMTDVPASAPGTGTFSDGVLSRYVWIYSPDNKDSLYYYNGHSPKLMLDPNGWNFPAAGAVIKAAPQDPVQIKSGYFLGYDHPAQVLSSPPSESPYMQHIAFLNGGDELTTEQTNNDRDLFTGYQMAPRANITNQRCIAIRMELDEEKGQNTFPVIYDPNYYIYDRYVAGVPPIPFSTLFGTSPAPGANTEWESYKPNPHTLASEWTTAKDDYGRSMMIDPGDGVAVYIANIVRNLPDARYSSTDEAQGYIFLGTGGYTPVSDTEISGNIPIQLTVYGGDCYITRNIINLRQNEIRPDWAELQDPAAKEFILDGSGGYVFDRVQKATSYIDFIEYLDVWVESEVNGHYVIRDTSGYPYRIATRDVTNEDIVGTPDYDYPTGSGLARYKPPSLYLYNPAYSQENYHKVLFSKDIREVDYKRIAARIQHSELQVLNSPTIGFDRWPIDNYFDLDYSLGGVTKIVSAASKRAYIVMDDAVAMMFLGTTLAEDEAGSVLNVGTGNVIGYVQYISNNDEADGDYGSSNIRSVRMTDRGLMFTDLKRRKVCIVSGSSAAQVSRYIEDFVEDRMAYGYETMDPEDLVAWWDNVKKRYRVYRNNALGSSYLGQGASMLFTNDGPVWETFLNYGAADVKAIVTQGGRSYSFIHRSGQAYIYQVGVEGTANSIMGQTIYPLVEVVLNNGQHAEFTKVLYSAIVHANSDPGVMAATVDGPDGMSITNVPLARKRQNKYIYNQFRDVVAPGRRIRDPKAIIRVTPQGTNRVTITGIHLNYRLDNRIG
ncbi:hypothetical protein [uncultured Sphaerochaeta sp.]|uniref:hypothetical protein n=1 Tax=uncultured Sphaerochaeta sp. TaxID=886478 RepID=UPI002602EBF9|nr:hypothetical protein [uncultured Sphaerochaeta sp.]